MKTRARYLLLNLFIIMSLSVSDIHGATPEFRKPDFAYPATVEKEAYRLLASAAEKSGETADLTRLRATLELLTARSMVDWSSQPEMIPMVDSLAHEQTTATGRAAMLILEADIYNNIYSRNRWKYDAVSSPLLPLPSDPGEWSGEQFRHKLRMLADEAEAAVKDSGNDTPLDSYKAVLEYNDISPIYFPSVQLWMRDHILTLLQTACDKTEVLEYARKVTDSLRKDSSPYFYWRTLMARLEGGDVSANLRKLYLDNKDCEAARYVLMECLPLSAEVATAYNEDGEEDDTAAAQRLEAERKAFFANVDILKESLEKFPAWWGNDRFRNEIADMTKPVMRITAPGRTAPGKSITLHLEYSFLTEAGIDIYQIPSGQSTNYKDIVGKYIKTTSVHFKDLDSGAYKAQAERNLTLSNPGTYALVAYRGEESSSDNSRIQVLNVTPFLPGWWTAGNTGIVAAMDFNSGEPMEDVSVIARSGKSYQTLGSTDSRGLLTFDGSKKDITSYAPLQFSYKGMTYEFANTPSHMYFPRNSDVNADAPVKALVFTDRALYHPGDPVGWTIVTATGDKGATQPDRVLSGEKFQIEFYDANMQPIDTCDVTTDGFGAATGTFNIPSDGLTGKFTITVRRSGGNQRLTITRITVSDFKLPTFETVVESVRRDYPQPGMVRLSGKATTYTGMPVAGAKVSADVSRASWYRYMFSASSSIGTVDTVTDGEGRYIIDIPARMLTSDGADVKSMNYSATVTVTSVAGETATSSRNFTLGKPYSLSLDNMQSKAIDGKSPATFMVNAYDPDGETHPIALYWSIRRMPHGPEIAKGTGLSGTGINIDMRTWKADKYEFSAVPADTTLAPALSPRFEFTLYNSARNEVPADEVLFIPDAEKSINYHTTGSDGSFTIDAGTGKDVTYLYSCFVADNEQIIDLGVQEIHSGFTDFTFRLPDGIDNGSLLFFTVRDGKYFKQSIRLQRPKPEAFRLKAESFRDKLTPGVPVTWRFRLSSATGNPVAPTAMTATMYNRALDALSELYWDSGFISATWPSYLTLHTLYNSSLWFYLSGTVKNLTTENLAVPGLRFFGSNTSVILSSNGRMMMKSASRIATNETYCGAVDMTAGAEEEVAREVKVEDMLFIEDNDEGSLAERIVDAEQHDNGFDYRVAELLQVFWEPLLVSDAEGNIDLTFTMPNAIGSWKVNAFAWTKDLRAGSYVAECMSNKPVMAEANLPRFLRQGDRATILANVYNNTDSTATVATIVEIFNPVTGEVIETFNDSVSVTAEASVLVPAQVYAAPSMAAVGYRVRATLGDFTDGEQSMIPVLESASTVIESTEFYLDPSQKDDFELTVDPGKDATVTLQYCQNPIWTLVKAMRGISAGNTPDIAQAYASALFSTLAAEKIVKDNPAMREVLEGWNANPSEQALVSMLSRNDDLKKMLLGQTPWVQTAADATARMEQLTEIFAPAKVKASKSAAIAGLKKLRGSDGGFRWAGWYKDESSEWVTCNVLTTIGIANSMGMIDKDSGKELAPIISSATAWLDSRPRRKIEPDFDLTLIHALLPGESVSVSARQVIDKTVQQIIAGWKSQSTLTKAWSVLILRANGYNAVASEVAESIRQFGVEMPGMGISFPSVNDIRGYATIIQALAATGATDAQLDAMRQWITVRAQATDNLGTYNPDYIIAAVMLTGSIWTDVPVENSVTINGHALTVDSAESASGYFSQRLDNDGSEMRITIHPNGTTPSYGSVISISDRPMTSVNARAGKDLSLTKRMLVLRDGKWVETTNPTLGERVRIQLTLKAGRDMQYIVINDERAGCLEPVDQLPGYIREAGLTFYRENRDAATNLFIDYLPKGTYQLTYDMTASLGGEFISGIATVQSQYAPELTAHSAGNFITVSSQK